MDDVARAMLISLSSSLLLYLLWVLISFLHKAWWRPRQIQKVMHLQGVNGPPYRFLYGNSKEIIKMRNEAMRRPMEHLSHQIFPRVQPHTDHWTQLYGKYFLAWIGSDPDITISEPELAKEILQNKESAYPKRDGKGFLKRLFGDGIVASEGERWAKQRKLANQAFRVESLKKMVPAMVESVEVMLVRWKEHEGKEIEVFEEFRLLTSEVISRTAFGSNYIEGKDIFEMLRKLTLLAVQNAFKIKFPFLRLFWISKDEIEAEKLEKGIQNSIIQIAKMREKLSTTKADNDFGTDLLGLLLKASKSKDENNHITINDLIDECKTFYLAGHETTTALLSWTILLLAIHQDWQDKAREEVLKLFGREHPNPEGLSKMKTLNMIINETLRLYPPVSSIVRKVGREVGLGNLLLPSKIHLTVPVMALHHDPQIWGEDVYLFKPERFAEGVAKATENKVATFIPFGLGPRICVGMNFATNEAKIALSMILQRYAFNISPTYVHSPVPVLTVCPQHGIPVVLHAL